MPMLLGRIQGYFQALTVQGRRLLFLSDLGRRVVPSIYPGVSLAYQAIMHNQPRQPIEWRGRNSQILI
jgi:hypothetical protein